MRFRPKFKRGQQVCYQDDKDQVVCGVVTDVAREDENEWTYKVTRDGTDIWLREDALTRRPR